MILERNKPSLARLLSPLRFGDVEVAHQVKGLDYLSFSSTPFNVSEWCLLCPISLNPYVRTSITV